MLGMKNFLTTPLGLNAIGVPDCSENLHMGSSPHTESSFRVMIELPNFDIISNCFVGDYVLVFNRLGT